MTMTYSRMDTDELRHRIECCPYSVCRTCNEMRAELNRRAADKKGRTPVATMTEARVRAALTKADIPVGNDDGLGTFSGLASVSGNDSESHQRNHGNSVAIYANVPGQWMQTPEGRAAQSILTQRFAQVLYEAGLTPWSNRGWKGTLVLVTIGDSLDDAVAA